MVFDESLAGRLFRFYPFDTGAVAASRIEVRASRTVADFRTQWGLPITSRRTPAQFVSTVYGTYQAYFCGDARPEAQVGGKNIGSILDILTGDTSVGIDYRRFSVECQSRFSVPLSPFLREVWVPRSAKLEMMRFQVKMNTRFYEDKYVPHFMLPVAVDGHVGRSDKSPVVTSKYEGCRLGVDVSNAKSQNASPQTESRFAIRD
jgi:hypothetical protein